ncbi:MAG: DegT/DnrJ/EryC1/StrS family aminotransferase [Acidobacteriaceae bacterium]
MVEIPLAAPDIVEDDIAAVVDVLRTPRLSLGPVAERFEHEMAAYVGASDAVAVSSGTAGLHLALQALGIGLGDEVIVPSFAFIAVASAVRYVGAHPVFADIDAETLNLDPRSVEAAVTLRTRAIVAVHTFGRPADMRALMEVAARHQLLVIEDACEAIGAEVDGQRVGSFGDAGVFGFYPNKQISTGEGGMVVTSHSDAARRMRALRNHGRYESPGASGGGAQDHAELGFNYRLTEMQCALGLSQLHRIDEILARREAIAWSYCERLSGNPRLQLPATEVAGQRLSWFVFVVRLAQPWPDRDHVMQLMEEAGIATGRYFAPIHEQPAYAAWSGAGSLLASEAVSKRTLALPFFNRMTGDQIERVCTALENALRVEM